MKLERILMIQNWIDALRSGDYEQGIGTIRGTDVHCCLGVLCDISGVGEWKMNACAQWTYRMRDTGKTGRQYPPSQLSQMVGLARPSRLGPNGEKRTYDDGNIQNHLAHMNDLNYTFEKIADEIEYIYEKDLKELECLKKPLPSRSKRP